MAYIGYEHTYEVPPNLRAGFTDSGFGGLCFKVGFVVCVCVFFFFFFFLRAWHWV